jgi:prepilin-type N-terminal cleavage/methylation domain-containing protein
MNTKTLKSSYGFTLIELMVVIAVVAVLAGSLVMAINPQSIVQKSRDAKRMQDIDTLAKALSLALAEGEIQLSVNSSSCTSCKSNNGTLVTSGSGYVKFVIPVDKTGLTKYLSTLPVDPLNTGNYVYTFGSTLNDFELNTVFEHADNLPRMTTDGGNGSAVYEVGTNLSIL